MNWNGGTIITGKQINFANGSFIEQYAGTIISTNTTHDIGVFQTTVSPPEHAKIVVRDLVLDGHTRPALYLPLLGVGVVRLRPRLGAVTIPPFSVFLLAEFEDFNVSEARVTFPYLHARTPETGVDSTNFINASDPFRSGSKNASTNVFGYVRIFRDVALDLKDLAGAAASEVAYYLADVDSGNRRTIDTFSDGDQVYSGVTSGGTAVLGRVLHAVHTIQAPETEAVYDNRTPSALDILTFLLFGYEYAPVPVATPMYGNGLLTVDQVMLPDASITEPVKATVDAYATIDNSAELYDAAKAYLHDNYAGELAPLLTRNGTTVDLGSLDLVIDAVNPTAFAFAAGVITISAAVFDGSITTSGTITLVDGATLSNCTTTARVILATSGISTYVLDACTLNEVENVSGTDATLNLLNGSSVAIEIETSGTITLFTVSKLTLTGLSGNDNVIVYDGNIGVLATASPVGEFSYTTVGSEVFLDTDKLVYVVIRPGYTDFFGAWDTTADLSLPFSATQFTQGNGSPMYQATSDVLWAGAVRADS